VALARQASEHQQSLISPSISQQQQEQQAQQELQQQEQELQQQQKEEEHQQEQDQESEHLQQQVQDQDQDEESQSLDIGTRIANQLYYMDNYDYSADPQSRLGDGTHFVSADIAAEAMKQLKLVPINTRLAQGTDARARFYLGRFKWNPGALEHEVQSGQWLVVNAGARTAELAIPHHTPSTQGNSTKASVCNNMWQSVMQAVGGIYETFGSIYKHQNPSHKDGQQTVGPRSQPEAVQLHDNLQPR
jgi:hypothetical protein